MEKFNYENVVEYVDFYIPEFKGETFVRDSPTLYFDDFAVFLVQLVESNNSELISRAVNFINDLADSKDTSLIAILDTGIFERLKEIDKNQSVYKNFGHLYSKESIYIYMVVFG